MAKSLLYCALGGIAVLFFAASIQSLRHRVKSKTQEQTQKAETSNALDDETPGPQSLDDIWEIDVEKVDELCHKNTAGRWFTTDKAYATTITGKNPPTAAQCDQVRSAGQVTCQSDPTKDGPCGFGPNKIFFFQRTPSTEGKIDEAWSATGIPQECGGAVTHYTNQKPNKILKVTGGAAGTIGGITLAAGEFLAKGRTEDEWGKQPAAAAADKYSNFVSPMDKGN